jgi:phage gpG-like protein
MTDPAAIRLTLALPGLPALSVGLNRLRTDIADWTPFWTERFAPFFYRMVQQDFVLEGGASGSPWAPLSPRYAAWKAVHFPGKGILVRSGALKASLASGSAPGAIFATTPTTLELGTTVPYGIYHQLGGAHLPQRPPLRVTAEFMRQVGKQMQAFVQDAWTARRKDFIADVAQGIHARLG